MLLLLAYGTIFDDSIGGNFGWGIVCTRARS